MTASVKKGVLAKVLLPTAILCSVLVGWNYWAQSENSKTANSLHRTSNSIGICFDRVGQSFTAVMLKDYTNQYLGNEFIETTKDCFEELKGQLEAVQSDWANAFKKFNHLLTDYHWFAEEVQKTASSEDSTVSVNENTENIMSYYQKVETHKNSLIDLLEQREKSMVSSWTRDFLVYGSLFVLIMLTFYGLWSSRVEDEQTRVQTPERDLAFKMEDAALFKSGGDTETADLFDITDLPTPDMYKNMASLNLNLTATGVAAILGNRAFAHGVLMDFDVAEDIYVKGQEDNVNQLLYSLIVYLMDGLKIKEGTRRIKIHAREINNKVELSVKADGLRFNKKELSYINLRSQNKDDIIGGELNICREIIEMSDLSLKLVNGMVDSEGYAKFIVKMRKGEPKNIFLDSSTKAYTNQDFQAHI